MLSAKLDKLDRKISALTIDISQSSSPDGWSSSFPLSTTSAYMKFEEFLKKESSKSWLCGRCLTNWNTSFSTLSSLLFMFYPFEVILFLGEIFQKNWRQRWEVDVSPMPVQIIRTSAPFSSAELGWFGQKNGHKKISWHPMLSLVRTQRSYFFIPTSSFSNLSSPSGSCNGVFPSCDATRAVLGPVISK